MSNIHECGEECTTADGCTSKRAEDPMFSKRTEWDWHGATMLPGWYFWDETWAFCHGPFSTYDECKDILERYCDNLEGRTGNRIMDSVSHITS